MPERRLPGAGELLAGLVLAAGLLAGGPPAARAQETFTLELEGSRVEVPTRRIGPQRYVAIADLARGFGGSVEWLEVGERAAVVFLGERLVFRRDLPFVEARGALHQIPHAPRFEGGELYVPFSFVQQGLPAIFPERFDFERETSSLREGPPGGAVDRIEYLVAPGLTTLRFFFAGAAPARVAADASLPHTLVVRVEGAQLGERLRASALAGLGLVDSVHVQEEPEGAERLVVHVEDEAFLYQVARLEAPAGFEVTLFSPAAAVDAEALLARSLAPPGAPALPPRPLAESGEVAAPRAAAPLAGSPDAQTPAVPPASPLAPPPVAAAPEASRRPRAGVRTVVIDAGHGGRDVGAVGPSGLFEKDVTLEVARALRAELERRSDLRVILTRERDDFVPLSARTRMANEAGAHLFISIHCNASRSRSGEGFETYFLSEAKTEDERRVARMENASLRFENPAIDPDQLEELEFILWDLAQNEYLRESSSLAELVQRSLAGELDLRDRGVKQAGFWVLNGAYMPAILVETAFISNPREERLLASRTFRQRLVEGLAESVMRYVEAYERKVAVREVGA